MTRAAKILEILGGYSKIPLKKTMYGDYLWKTTIDGNEVSFEAHPVKVKNDQIAKITFERKSNGRWTMSQVQSDQKLAIKILSAASNFIQTVIEEVPVNGVVFSANSTEPSRIKAYNRMAQKLASSKNGSLKIRDQRGPTIGTSDIFYREYLITW